ncbi:MAG TPA: hypothetical protein VFE78_26060 [Gemmataceae bacterium]|jgi:hypothetical protein|nr:hypothetical protein [Gemmataceae bacterium]
MQRSEDAAWALSVWAYLRPSRAKLLADLADLAALGRSLTGPQGAKHRIKRRALPRQRPRPGQRRQGPGEGPCRRRKRPLLVALGWTRPATSTP